MLASKSFSIDVYQQQADNSWLQQTVNDQVIFEEPLEIHIKSARADPGDNSAAPGSTSITLMRTPGDDISLVKGWLFSSGLIDSESDIIAIHHTGSAHLRYGVSNQLLVVLSSVTLSQLRSMQRLETASSACGICGQQSIEQLLLKLDQRRRADYSWQTSINLSALVNLSLQLSRQQAVFAQTGGSHGAALFDRQLSIVDVREDVGRHNALDKVIGANLLPQSSASPQVTQTQALGVILSGRVAYEMVQKAAMANLQIILALGAPSSLAVELARETDITLIGFIKSRRCNVYHCASHSLTTTDN